MSEATKPSQIHCYISGRVQQVSFRYWTKKTALELGLKGWVRNLYDGRVEALIQGDSETLKIMHRSLHEGPYYSRVDSVVCENAEVTEIFEDFRIR